jgi:ammonium transporter Rh
MTFLKKNGFGAVGYTFMIGVFCIQWHILVNGLVHGLFASKMENISLTLDSLMLGDFAAGAVLITYGGILGKTSPMQLLAIATMEVIFFTINENIGLKMGQHDLGGSMVVHMFGAYFGMGCSIMMIDKNRKPSQANNSSVYHADLFAMIGTVFLWMFWPSFNAAPSTDDWQQHRAVVNTILSLAGSGFSAFLASYYIRKERKFDMVDIQNATLAGGVAMGTCCDLMIGPGAALLIGCLAGVLSVVGYVHIQPALETKLGFLDTCGINNLHGMPSILGALAGVIACAAINPSVYVGPACDGAGCKNATYPANSEVGHTFNVAQLEAIYAEVAAGRSASDQALNQLGFMAITLCISLVGGALTGIFVKQSCFDPFNPDEAFLDAPYWEVPDMEFPYYFDKRGEIASHGDAKKGDDTLDPMVESKIRGLEGAIKELRVTVRQRRASVSPMKMPQMPPMYFPPPAPAPAASKPDLELQLMVSKLMNKMDEQALEHSKTVNQLLAISRGPGAAPVETQPAGSRSPSLKYVV